MRRVLTSHGSTRDSLRKRAYLALDERGIYPFYDRIVAVSQELGSRLQRERFGSRVATVQNGFDFELFRELAPEEPEVRRRLAAMKSPGGFLFAVVGRLFPDKGHVYFLEAFQRLKPLFPRIKAVFVGEGPYRSRLEEWIPARARRRRNVLRIRRRHAGDLLGHRLPGHALLDGGVAIYPA